MSVFEWCLCTSYREDVEGSTDAVTCSLVLAPFIASVGCSRMFVMRLLVGYFIEKITHYFNFSIPISISYLSICACLHSLRS